MLEKRFIELLDQYKEQMKNIKLTPNVQERLKYIKNCLDHLENEIDDLTVEIDKSKENKLYQEIQKDLGPMILWYLASKSEL